MATAGGSAVVMARMSLLGNCDTPRKLADLDRLDDLEICYVDDGDVIRHAVGRQKILFVRGERHVPDALAHEKIFLNLIRHGVDHGDAICRTKGYEPSLPIPGDADSNRLDGPFRSPGISKLIFFFTSCFTGSMILTVPPISDETQTSEPSRLNSANRGRASTNTLATIRRVSVSMKCAILVVSDVATRILPSGLRPMPSGSTPTCTSARGVRRSKSIIVTVLSFSLAT